MIAPAARGAGGFGAPVVVTGLDLGEPGIDVASDGTIYVNAPPGLQVSGSPSLVFRSDDGGATWALTPPGARSDLPGGGDSDLSVDPVTGTLYMTDLWLGSATVSRSTDRGESWVANPLQGVVVQDRQWVATAGGGNVYHATHQIPAGLVVSKSMTPTDGLAYSQSTVAATPADQTGCVCPPGTLIAEPGTAPLGSGDRVGLVYFTSTGGINFARSLDGAVTFTNVPVSPPSSADTTHAFPVVASAANDTLHAVWLEVFGTASSRVRYARSSNWGASWTKPATLVGSGTSVYPWVAARGDKVSVTVYHTDASGTQSVTLDGAGRANATWTRSIDGQSDTEIRFARQ
ncbi:MAG: exo-alpha-sialidase [Deltaproteobacteria bacterium]|nr:MAG: exo-alpha-sialidase [Deltaproteobacteria bacterium]